MRSRRTSSTASRFESLRDSLERILFEKFHEHAQLAPSRPVSTWRRIREDFPVLKQTIHGKPLVYLDNAATAQKPHAVIDAIRKFHEVDCANIHRGVHELSQRSTAAYEETRVKVQALPQCAHARAS